MSKKFSNSLGIFIFFFVVCCLLSVGAYAIDMTSTNYQIIFSNLNIGGNRHTSATYNLNSSLGQTFADRFTSAGYIAKVGFQYIYTQTPFSFRVSTTLISLGTLLPNTFATQALTVTVNNPSRGYDVQVIEDRPLTSFALNTIPNTACDGGTPCTKTSANVWLSTSAYGFGYGVTGNDVSTDFINSTYFRPFAARSSGDSPVTFMTSAIAGVNRISTVTFKANVSGSQPAGTYQTVVDFIAVPKY